MTTEILQHIATFLSRTELRGSEVPAFNACMDALENEFHRLGQNESPVETGTKEEV